jgi:23S rRNA (guanosine2251-2'-O)-methyltransferase
VAETQEQVEGRNPVLEALRGPREVHVVYVASGAGRKGALAEILNECERQGVQVREVPRQRLDAMAETAAPQGVVASVAPYRYATPDEITAAPGGGAAPLVLVLEGVEDPRNLGSLLRIADAAAVDGVILARRRSAHVTAAVAKASAGAVEHVRVAQVSNIASTLTLLKRQDLWVVGAEAKGGVPFWELDLRVPLALVLGGEGKGLSRLVKERCDHLASLPMLGRVSSLNVSNAGAVLLFEAVRQRSSSA